ncbi:MAG: hypothetical protein ABII00_13375 [Elusimicrobiota bacterium]
MQTIRPSVAARAPLGAMLLGVVLAGHHLFGRPAAAAHAALSQAQAQMERNAQRREREVAALPEPSLGHLKALTDDIGIFEHASGTSPNKAHGYCAEDVARALVAVLMFDKEGGRQDGTAQALAETYMRYLRRSQRKDGGFHHRTDTRGRLSEETTTGDAYGRALWGLGYAVAHPASPAMGARAREMFREALPGSKALVWPRAIAYALLGLHHYLTRFPDDPSAKESMTRLADALVGMFEANSSADWRWFDDEMTYDNAKLPQALLLAYESTGNKAYLRTAETTLDFLVSVNFPGRDMLQVIGNKGWYRRGGEPALYDQQPTDAASMVEALAAAYRLTGRKEYRDLALKSFGWFLGGNIAGEPLYDPSTGGCRDGLGADGINQNQGAESSIMALIALLTARQLSR